MVSKTCICHKFCAELSLSSLFLEDLQNQKAPKTKRWNFERYCSPLFSQKSDWTSWTSKIIHRLIEDGAKLLPNVVRPHQDPLAVVSCYLYNIVCKLRFKISHLLLLANVLKMFTSIIFMDSRRFSSVNK